MTPFQYLSAGLGLLLAASVALNGFQYHQHDKYVSLAAQANQYADDTKASAGACSASVDQLSIDGTKRQAELVRLLKGIAPAVAEDQLAAIAALSARPDDPKDLCGSAHRYLQLEVPKDHAP